MSARKQLYKISIVYAWLEKKEFYIYDDDPLEIRIKTVCDLTDKGIPYLQLDVEEAKYKRGA